MTSLTTLIATSALQGVQTQPRILPPQPHAHWASTPARRRGAFLLAALVVSVSLLASVALGITHTATAVLA